MIKNARVSNGLPILKFIPAIKIIGGTDLRIAEMSLRWIKQHH
jgi:hypothetical protein